LGQNAQFVLSAASVSDFPTTGLPEIALVGRSNVGKSSLINALTKQKIARTSAAPGKTRLANYYLLDSGLPASGSSLYLVDLPGYGYARGGPESADAFEQLTRQYFDGSNPQRRLAGVLQLIDARHPDLPQDAAAFEWLMRTQLPLAVVATKIDKLNRSEQARTTTSLQDKYGVRVVPESAISRAGLDEIWKLVREWANDRSGSR
jgi:GTP-binding protein